MPFKHIEEPKKKSANVAEEIMRAIRMGEFKPGESLPSERKMAVQMGVSRNSVREALSALQIVGIVESKAGSGTYVTSYDKKVDIERALSLVRDSEDLMEIWEARREIEKILARMALRRAESEDLDELRSVLELFEDAVEKGDYQDYHRANQSFHLLIADLADNIYLKNALEALMEVTGEHLLKNLVPDYQQYMEKSLSIHKRLLKLIHSGDERDIERAVNRHFLELEEYLEERLFRD
ncbi:MAG: FCD domain-containing protein [Candidatus Latescibacteria bacterium]|nr:FCD domain-containing protein [Candidatus Latescibacterota bacterium]